MMPDRAMYAWRNPWFRWSVSALVVFALVTLLVGFVWLPSVQGDFTAKGLWDGICRAAGVPSEWRAPTKNAPDAGPRTTSVVLTRSLARAGSSEATGRGATLAIQQCSMCHGAQGVSESGAPNLAGQYPEVVIKQLHDYKRGDRSSAIMQSLARKLSDRDILDIASYYDSLPRAKAAQARVDDPEVPALVRVGDPLRNIVPCMACHGGIEHKLGAPWLEGMPKAYLLGELQAFASGARRNDSYGQMRNMVRTLTPQELDRVAEFYARREPEAGKR
jgi:cytochrome c553